MRLRRYNPQSTAMEANVDTARNILADFAVDVTPRIGREGIEGQAGSRKEK